MSNERGTTENNVFGALDYAVFGTSLVICIGIGMYHAFKHKSSSSTDGFLMGDRDLKVLPLTVSLVVSVVSAVTLLGVPAEIYTHGSQYFFNIGSGLGIIMTAVVFVPLLHPLRLTSMFEYLERRFESASVRLTGSLLEVLALVLYGGTALYAPATAIAAVTPLPTWSLCLGLGVIVTLYTCLGGLKGVIWTDVFQAVVMVTGIFAVFIRGMMSVGGIHEVYKYSMQGDRLHFYNFDVDPRTRHTFWGLVIGFGFGSLSFYGASQFTFQRFSATKRLRDAKLTVLLNLPLFYCFHILLCFTGLLIYAYYAKTGCDPIKSNRIQSSNQLLPLFVLDTVGQVPAVTGLFMAALTGGALSTISSVINSASALVWQDFLRQFLETKLSTRMTLLLNKLLVLVIGTVVVSLTFLADNFGPHIFQVSFAFLGASGGPQLGMFLLGALIPWANAKGAILGCLSGLALTSWITVGTYITKPFSPILPHTSTEQCLNFTLANRTAVMHVDNGGLVELYKMSYVWYSLIGAVACLLVGTTVSAFTGKCNPDPILVLPWYGKIRNLLARCCKKDSDHSEDKNVNSVELEEQSHILKGNADSQEVT